MSKFTEKISFFLPPITNTTPRQSIFLEDFHRVLTGQARGINYKNVVDRLRELPRETKEEKAKRSDFKKSNLGFITPHGTFTQRADDNLVEPSGLFVADIDFYSWDAEPFMEAVKSDPYLRLAFRGPSGAGSAKLLFRIDPDLIPSTGSGRMKVFLDAAEAYLRQTYGHLFPSIPAGGRLLDPTGKDLARACFASYDPDAYLGPEEGERMDSAFIARYGLPEDAPAQSLFSNPSTPAKSGTQAPANYSIDGLAEKHMKRGGAPYGDAHHHEVVAFISAAKACGHSIEAVKAFLAGSEWISPESAESDAQTLERTLSDLYQRYPVTDPGVVQLKDGKIGFGLLTYSMIKNKGYQHDGGLYNEGILNLLHDAGFCRRKLGSGYVLARKLNGILEEVCKDDFRTFVQTHFKTHGGAAFNAWGKVHITASAAMETLMKQAHNIFNNEWLGFVQLDETPLLRDEEKAAFIPFLNGVLKVEAGRPALLPWSEFSGAVVWRDQVVSREINLVDEVEGSHFFRFLRNVTAGDDKRLYSLMTALGYMLHHYNRQSEGQAVILNDEVITDARTPKGGSGKGVIVQALKSLRKTAKIDGKHFDGGDRFRFQSIGPDTQIVWIDDAKPNFDFSLLHSNLTDGWSVERKNLPVLQIPAADSPKTIIASNTVIKGDGSTNRRRQFVIEIGDYYSKRIRIGLEKPIEEEHGCLFFSEDWPADEWDMFYSFMAACLQAYLKDGLVYFAGINTDRNRLTQRTSEDFMEWVEGQAFATHVPYETKRLFEEYQTIYGEDRNFKQKYFSEWLKRFAENRGWEVQRKREKFHFVDTSVPKSTPTVPASEPLPHPDEEGDEWEAAPF